jgi:RNA polymerase sigma factor (sigma-70 family)
LTNAEGTEKGTDFYGRILIPPTEVAHNRLGLDAAVAQVRHTFAEHQLHDGLVAIERTGRYHRIVQRSFAAGFDARIVHPFVTKQYRQPVDREQPIRAVLADQSSIELLGELIDRELTPATAALRREMETAFQEAVNQLDEDDREIILLRHFEQLSNQDVAKALDLSEAAASMRYLRALRRLRAVIAPA